MRIETVERILVPFVEEALPGGGIDMSASRWQKPGRGFGGTFPDQPDVRYMHALVDLLYRLDKIVPHRGYDELANRQVGFMVRFTREDHPSWLQGTTLQCIGFHHQHNGEDRELKAAALRIVDWARKRKVEINTGEVSYSHFSTGYDFTLGQGWTNKDHGWTNDLSILGSGLVFAYEITGDETILDDAASFAEFFVQPWKPDALGRDGYWHCGTWREDIGCWCIGPAHFAGVENTGRYTDEVSWVFSSYSCIDYLRRLYRHKPDSRFPDRCLKAARWTFDDCQFQDGAVGMCGKDDKWLGSAGYAISQILSVRQMLLRGQDVPQPLLVKATHASRYLSEHLPAASMDQHGVTWVTHTTYADPMVNVGWMFLNAGLGFLDSEQL